MTHRLWHTLQDVAWQYVQSLRVWILAENLSSVLITWKLDFKTFPWLFCSVFLDNAASPGLALTAFYVIWLRHAYANRESRLKLFSWDMRRIWENLATEWILIHLSPKDSFAFVSDEIYVCLRHINSVLPCSLISVGGCSADLILLGARFY